MNKSSFQDHVWELIDEWKDNRLPGSGSYREAARELDEVLEADETVVYEYDEMRHNRDGKQVPCRNCGQYVFLTHIPDFGCHVCDTEPRPVTIKAKQKDNFQ